MEQALMCPQCNAPLKPSRFSQNITCSYCGAVTQIGEPVISRDRFRKAFKVWNAPGSYPVSSWLSLGDNHWAIDTLLGNGDISDVYSGMRARWPSELVLIKILRDARQSIHFDNEWNAIKSLLNSKAPGAETFTTLIPQPIANGTITDGSFVGSRASIFRWAAGFEHTFEAVRKTYAQGIPPRASIWVWRRILEILSFIHNPGMVHGAVLPPHLLIQKNDHGVRLVGYGCAGRAGGEQLHTPSGYEAFYPTASAKRLTPQLDLVMSARCIAFLLGGDPAKASLPANIPTPLSDLIRRIALSDPERSTENAWAIRDELGDIANNVFGKPQFTPIVMPA